MKTILFIFFFSLVTFGQTDICQEKPSPGKTPVSNISIEEVNKLIEEFDQSKTLFLEINGEIKGRTALLIKRDNVCLSGIDKPLIKRTEFNGENEQPVIRIENAKNVTVKGFNIEGTIEENNCPADVMGIYVVNSKNEAISNLRILNNQIQTIGQVYVGACVDKSEKESKHNLGQAHGINVRMSSSQKGNANSKITGVFIQGNTLNNLRLGSSEAIALNGNISNFNVSANTISDVDNIAIDIIGGSEGKFQPTDGIVAENIISGLLPGNGTYPFVAGVYIDGGTGLNWDKSIKVTGNTVSGFGIGISVGSENNYCKNKCNVKTEYIEIQANTLKGNQVYGLGIGKDYKKQNSKTWSIKVIGNTIIDNVLSKDESGYSQLHFGSLIKDSLKDIEIRGNKIKSSGENSPLLVRIKGSKKYLTPDIKFYENIFYSDSSNIWSWGKRSDEKPYTKSELISEGNKLKLPEGVKGDNNTWNQLQ